MAQVPRPAATLILVRPGARGPEVLMIQRTQSAAFLGGAYVFPGGAIDAADSEPRVLDRVRGLTAEQAGARLGVPNGLAYYVAALRESFEEAGVLLLLDKNGSAISARRAEKLEPHRKTSFADLIETEADPLKTALREQTTRIKAAYAALSDSYQASKSENDIPLN